MRHLETIVIGTALTPESDEVVRTGVELARRTGASAYLVHAYVPPTAFAGMPAEVLAGSDWTDTLPHRLREQLVEQARRTGLADLAGSGADRCVLAIDSTHHALAATAKRTRADLIVVGASERAWHRLSPTADRVLRKAPCPVLTVRPAAAFPPRRAVLPVDLSAVSARALRYGVELLAGLGAPPCEILFVLTPRTAQNLLQFTPAQVTRFAADELVRFVAAQVPQARHLELEVRDGDPAQVIVQEVAERGADLVVLGTHGHGLADRLLLGSVTSDVLREARCSVLAVPPGAQTAWAGEAAEEVRAPADWSSVADEVTSPA